LIVITICLATFYTHSRPRTSILSFCRWWLYT